VLRVAVIELPARWSAVDEALRDVEEALDAGPATDLVLLPEASLTGYVSPELDFDLTRFAEPIDGPTARALASLAVRYETHLFGPSILEEDGECFNATLGFAPSGEHVVTYRKRHPWIPESWATPGREPYPLVEVAGAKVTIACCFDVHFLAREAAETLNAADLLLFPSAWVEEVDTRPRRLKTIARKHRVAVAAANWGRGDLRVAGQGGSCILDANGDVVAKVTAGGRRIDATL
jgi:predicted amidohydrolase